MRIVCLALILASLPAVGQAENATKASAEQGIAKAKVALLHAAALNDQWTATVAAFKAAQAAAQKGDYVAATTQAKRARMLAGLSIAQATAQQKLWRNEVVH